MKSRVGRIAICLALILLLNGTYMVRVPSVKAQAKTSAEKIISSLTPEQREALNKLEGYNQSGLLLDKDVDLNSEKSVSVILELKQQPAKIAVMESSLNGKTVKNADEEQKVKDSQKKLTDDLKAIFKGKEEDYKISRSYTTVFNGISVTMPANKIKEVMKSDAVKAIYSNEEVSLTPVKDEDTTNKTNLLPDLGTSKLHEEGYTGTGVKVGVIDTGIDYNHPDLKDAYKGGYDFVDNDSDPMETTYADWKKSGYAETNLSGAKYYTEHGTHVCGIIAGQGKNNKDYAVTGVAPGASLYVYRVLGPYGVGYDDTILAGVEKAVKDGMNVINLSLGGSSNYPLDPPSIAINNAVLLGTTAVISAGNYGSTMATVGTPGTAALALTVGACDYTQNIPTYTCAYNGKISGNANLQMMAYNFGFNAQQLEGKSYGIVDVGVGNSTSYKNKNVNGKFVLISRANYSFHSLIQYSKSKGAAGAIIYNNNPNEGQIPYFFAEGYDYIPTFSMNNQQGIALKNAINNNSVISFSADGQITMPGDNLAGFSSRGPANRSYDIKPEIVAPGVSIFSTVPSYMHGASEIGNYDYAYERLDGTSMASPYAAGTAALVLQSNHNLTPSEVKSVIMNTADKMNGDYSVYEVGAGRIDPYRAVHSTAELLVQDKELTIKDGKETYMKEKTGDLRFGVFGDNGQTISENRNIAIKSSSNKVFNIAVQYNNIAGKSEDAASNGVEISVNSSIVVKANSQYLLNVGINIPSAAKDGDYEGYVVLTNKYDTNESYRIPFAAVKTKEGIKTFYLDSNFITTPVSYADNNMIFACNMIFGLNSNMRDLDFTVVDGNTGNPIGIVEHVDGAHYDSVHTFKLSDSYAGQYYPFTGDSKNPVSTQAETLGTGYYKIRLVATDYDGKIFTSDFPIYIDNNLPVIQDLKLNTQQGDIAIESGKPLIYEYDPLVEDTVGISGTCYDKDLNEMQKDGIDPFSRPGYKNYYVGSMYDGTLLSVDRNGKISGQYSLNPDMPIDNNGIEIFDAVGNDTVNDDKEVYLVKKGTPYLLAEPNASTININDNPEITLSIKNASNLKEVNFSYSIDGTQGRAIGMKLKDELKDTATLSYNIKKDSYNDIISAKVTFKNAINCMDNKFSFAEIEINNIKDAWYEVSTVNQIDNSTYTDKDGKTSDIEGIVLPYLVHRNQIDAMCINWNAEGVLDFNNPVPAPIYGFYKDYSKLGFKAYFKDKNNVIYNCKYNGSMCFEAYLPYEKKDYTLVFDAPGHFTVYRNYVTDRVGEIGGDFHQTINYNYAIAGDVNKDNVIDIMDAYAIVDTIKKGVYNRSCDINADGIIDGNDLYYVQKNYLMQNPTYANSPKAKTSYKGMTLDDLLNSYRNWKISKVYNKLKH